MLSMTNGWVAKDSSSADDLTHSEETQDVNRGNTQLGQVALVWLELLSLLNSSPLLLWGLQEVHKLLVNLLELSLAWWGKTFILVNNFAELSGDLGPVNSTVGKLVGLLDSRVDEPGGLGDDGRHVHAGVCWLKVS